MQTSVIKTTIKKKNLKRIRGQQGFSLVEILMAIFLSVLVVSLVVSGLGEDDHSILEDTMRKIERAARFATDESILRNKLVRLQFSIEEEQVTYKIEYGQSANMVLPESVDFEKLSLKEREAELKKQKKLDSQFVSIEEFDKDSEPLPEKVGLFGIGTAYYPQIMQEGKLNIYFYPTGEKDNTIIFLYTAEELATLSLLPFENRTKKNFMLFTEVELDDIDSTLENKSKELFEKWLKE